jgi:hypothetical protein
LVGGRCRGLLPDADEEPPVRFTFFEFVAVGTVFALLATAVILWKSAHKGDDD